MAKRKSNQSRKKKEEKKVEELKDPKEDLQNKIFIAFCVVLFFLSFYLLTLYITNKHAEPKEEEEEATEEVEIKEILIGKTFSMNDREYYVLFYDTKDKDIKDDCSEMYEDYYARNGRDSIYYVDMNSGFNKNHTTTEESNKNPETEADLLINGPTLIRVEGNHSVDYVEGIDAIREKLEDR